MFGSDLLEIQKEVRNNKIEAKKVEEEKTRQQVIKYLEGIKKELETAARDGDSSLVEWYKINEEQQRSYELLRELCWKEGISITRSSGTCIRAEVKPRSIYDTYESLLGFNTVLEENERQFLVSEYAYAMRINGDEDVLKIGEEIARKDKSDQKNAMLALANALYKNGLEGCTPEVEGILFKIQSTVEHVLGSHCTEEMKNHTEILHYYNKENINKKNINKGKAKKRG